MGFFWTKYVMFELKKYKGVMFDGTEDFTLEKMNSTLAKLFTHVL